MIASTFNLRLHIEHLRLEGVGPMTAEELAADIEQQLVHLVDAYGTPPPLAGGGSLRLDGARVRVEAGWSREQVAVAIARQLFEQWYGPLIAVTGPWAGRGLTPGPDLTRVSKEETS